MLAGMSAYTLIHVLLSVIGIVSGIVVAAAMLDARRPERWTLVFLAATAATSVTGFGFHRDEVLPSHVVGGVSLVLLGAAVVALYVFALARAWRWIYVTTALASLYLNVFVLVVQAFVKVPALNALAPTQKDAPFVAAQVVVLAAFVALGVAAVRRFHPR